MNEPEDWLDQLIQNHDSLTVMVWQGNTAGSACYAGLLRFVYNLRGTMYVVPHMLQMEGQEVAHYLAGVLTHSNACIV